MKQIIAAALLVLPMAGHLQELRPDLIDTAPRKQRTVSFWGELKEKKTRRWGIDFVINRGWTAWSPINDETAETEIRRGLERFYPELSSGQMNNFLWDMQYQGILSTFQYASQSFDGLGPKVIRLRYQPFDQSKLHVSLGLVRTPGMFYANFRRQVDASVVSMNQTETMASLYLDQYFHLREIYENYFLEFPQVPDVWRPQMLEVGGSYELNSIVSIAGGVALIPNGSRSVQQWYNNQRDGNIASSLTDLDEVVVANQFSIGCQLGLGAFNVGIEQRMMRFNTSITSYTDNGSSAPEEPNYTGIVLGYRW